MHCRRYRFMLPRSHDRPALQLERFCERAVAQLSPGELQSPEFSICRRKGGMRRTGVPEAPVNKDGHLHTRKCDVYFAAECRRFEVNPITIASTVKCRTDRKLRPSIARTIRFHSRPSCDGWGSPVLGAPSIHRPLLRQLSSGLRSTSSGAFSACPQSHDPTS
jgi:hypothetical protein